MKDLFMCLLLNVVNHGKLTEANMYQGGEFSTMKIVTDSGTYSISISKEEEKENV
jgi:hypothetical protein